MVPIPTKVIVSRVLIIRTTKYWYLNHFQVDFRQLNTAVSIATKGDRATGPYVKNYKVFEYIPGGLRAVEYCGFHSYERRSYDGLLC